MKGGAKVAISDRTVAIIGTGNIGGILASDFAAGGQDFLLAGRDQEAARKIASDLGGHAEVVSVDEAVDQAGVLVLAVWLDGALYTTSADEARKGRNLAADPRCTVTARTDTMDVVLEGTATRVAKEATLQQIAEAYRSKYDWPVTVTDGAFDAPYGAPTAGPPPYHPYEITPATVFGFGTADEYAGRATRYRF